MEHVFIRRRRFYSQFNCNLITTIYFPLFYLGKCDPLKHFLQRLFNAGPAENLAAFKACSNDEAFAVGGRHEGVLGLLSAEGVQSNCLQLFEVSGVFRFSNAIYCDHLCTRPTCFHFIDRYLGRIIICNTWLILLPLSSILLLCCLPRQSK